jgi:hypothetical protein
MTGAGGNHGMERNAGNHGMERNAIDHEIHEIHERKTGREFRDTIECSY